MTTAINKSEITDLLLKMATKKGACRKRKWSKSGSLSLLWEVEYEGFPLTKQLAVNTGVRSCAACDDVRRVSIGLAFVLLCYGWFHGEYLPQRVLRSYNTSHMVL